MVGANLSAVSVGSPISLVPRSGDLVKTSVDPSLREPVCRGKEAVVMAGRWVSGEYHNRMPK